MMHGEQLPTSLTSRRMVPCCRVLSRACFSWMFLAGSRKKARLTSVVKLIHMVHFIEQFQTTSWNLQETTRRECMVLWGGFLQGQKTCDTSVAIILRKKGRQPRVSACPKSSEARVAYSTRQGLSSINIRICMIWQFFVVETHVRPVQDEQFRL